MSCLLYPLKNLCHIILKKALKTIKQINKREAKHKRRDKGTSRNMNLSKQYKNMTNYFFYPGKDPLMHLEKFHRGQGQVSPGEDYKEILRPVSFL